MTDDHLITLLKENLRFEVHENYDPSEGLGQSIVLLYKKTLLTSVVFFSKVLLIKPGKKE